MFPLLKDMQKRVAEVAIDAPTVRRQGEGGVVKAVRCFLSRLDLREFAASDEDTFCRVLERVTEELKQSLPGKARSWGLARKCLNIFLRDSFYNAYLRAEFGLTKAEQWYKVPLDSNVAKGLKKEAKAETPPFPLPTWTNFRDLQPTHSASYQAFALSLAKRKGLPARVHLDLIFWRAKTCY